MATESKMSSQYLSTVSVFFIAVKAIGDSDAIDEMVSQAVNGCRRSDIAGW
jgi:hypothetical protein